MLKHYLCITLGKYYWAFTLPQNEKIKLRYKKYRKKETIYKNLQQISYRGLQYLGIFLTIEIKV